MISNRRKPLPSSPKSYPMNPQGSPTKGSILLQDEHVDYISKLSSRKNNLVMMLDCYSRSYDHAVPQKCFDHNDFITLYCEDQSKLLCVNCLYKSIYHKDHSVVPSSNSIASIQRDNQTSLKMLEDELEKTTLTQNQIRKNRKSLQEEYRVLMKEVQDQFAQIYHMIQLKEKQTKDNILDAFDRATKNNEFSLDESTWWKSQLGGIKSNMPRSSNDMDTEIYKHLVLGLIQKGRIDSEKLTYMPSGQQIQDEFLKDVVVLRQNIQNWLQMGGRSNLSRSKGMF